MPHLPNELFTEILSNLPARDLASTSLVSWRFRALSLPLLYREPRLTTNVQRCGSFQQFARTLLTPSHGYLGSFVACLTITWTHDPSIDRPTEPCPSEIDQLSELLPLLPGMTGLHLLCSPHIPWDRLSLMGRPPAVLAASAMQSLRDFTYQWRLRSDLINSANLLTLLSLPELRSLELRQNHWYRLGDGAPPATGTSALTRLTLRSGQRSVLPLHALLRLPRPLTHLAYLGDETGAIADLAVLGRALLPVRHSLVRLTITLPSRPPRGAYRPSVGTLGGLREWPALRDVRCPLVVLVDIDAPRLGDVLPLGIRELHILGHCDVKVSRVVMVVLGLLAAKDVVAPALQTLAVCVGCPKSKRERRELRRVAWAAGVAVRLES